MVLAAEGLTKEAETTWPSRSTARASRARSRAPTRARRSREARDRDERGRAARPGGAQRQRQPDRPRTRRSLRATVERNYFRLDGSPVNPRPLRQNDRLVVVLKVTEARPPARPLLVDRLPAGLEIDNPSSRTATPPRPAWSKPRANLPTPSSAMTASLRPSTGARSLRLLHRRLHGPRGLPGHLCPSRRQVEDMYRPDRFGRTAFGSLTIEAAR